MAKRRGNREGSIYHDRARQRLVVAVSIGRGKDGKLKRVRRTLPKGSTMADARELAKQLLCQNETGVFTASKLPISQFLNDWLVNSVKPNHTPSTFANYNWAVTKWSGPIGHIRLCDLTPQMVREYRKKLVDYWGASLKTVRSVFRVLSSAMEDAVEDGKIPANPFRLVRMAQSKRRKRTGVGLPPKKPKPNPFTLDEVKAILKAVDGHRLEALFVLAFMTSLSQHEAFAVWWDCVDFGERTVKVIRGLTEVGGVLHWGDPKTENRDRVLYLPERCIDALHEHRKRQIAEGNASSTLVFCTARGKPMRRSTFSARTWKPLLKELGIKPRGFHQTRHSFTTRALAMEHEHVVQKICGHADSSTTRDIYGGILSDDHKAAVDRLNRMWA